VTFHNAENGFCVLRVKARGQRDLITVLGHAAMISAGEFVQASGTWVNDRTHGVQFRASFLKATAPTTVEGIEKYLGPGMLRGIGPVYAKKLVRAFGEAVFDVIEQEPPRLRQSARVGRAGALISLPRARFPCGRPRESRPPIFAVAGSLFAAGSAGRSALRKIMVGIQC
jgi:exodeoxyribonuclease V alpha subunit